MEELQSKAPTLLHLLTTIVTFNDHRNVSKIGVSHHPGICAAVAVLEGEEPGDVCNPVNSVGLDVHLPLR